MVLASSVPPSTVSFPVSEPSLKNAEQVAHLRPPHLPFRRISLPTAPSKIRRESIISVASFDSLPEEGEPQARSIPTAIKNIHSHRSGKGRPTSNESPRRSGKRDVPARPVDNIRESKRRKVVEEFYDTEKAYVDGLELIYSHFLSPIIASLDTPNPLLDRSSLTSVFSNFIDIWNLHRSFFSSLSTLLSHSGIPTSASTSPPNRETPPPLSPILLSHFPYLSLYNPFVTSFASTISALAELITPASASLANPQYNPAFAAFLSTQEADPRCNKLKLRDWLLTIVQRCPRYLLLLKDLIGCTNPDDPEHGQLTVVHTLVSKITLSLNTSLHTHAQTLALLSLQRSTPNLPFQLIAPGRTLLKRGPLLQIERSVQPRKREFLLFSDCLLWLANEDAERVWKGDWGIGRSGWGAGYLGNGGGPLESSMSTASSPTNRPLMVRSRSKSEAELSLLRTKASGGAPLDAADDIETSSPSTPMTPHKHAGRFNAIRKSHHPPPSLIKRHSSSGVDERWVYKGRVELVDLEVVVIPPREEGEERRFEVLSPEGSFVLYSTTEDERDEWCATIRQAKAQLLVSLNVTHPNSTLTSSSSTNHLRRSLQALPFPPSDDRIATIRDSNSKGKGQGDPGRRRKVEHWVPAIWIPDEKTGGCMRCGRSFGWRKRRHHCRLCGRCVCALCSGRTFFISDPNAKDNSSKAARACDACYESVFPLIDPPQPTSTTDSPGTIHRKDMDVLASLSNLPSWLSMPSRPVSDSATPQALMAIVREPSSPNALFQDLPDLEHGEKRGRLRVKSSQNLRPKSYHHLLEDFEQNEHVPLKEKYGADEGGEGPFERDREPLYALNNDLTSSSSPRKENTERRNKRFSLPAVALHTTSVTARSSAVFEAVPTETLGDNGVSPVKVNKRFSLVLGGGRNHGGSAMMISSEATNNAGQVDSIAAGRLSELLGRRKA